MLLLPLIVLDGYLDPGEISSRVGTICLFCSLQVLRTAKVMIIEEEFHQRRASLAHGVEAKKSGYFFGYLFC